MLLMTGEKVESASYHSNSRLLGEPFQPGEVYLIRYMSTPAVVTIRSRDDNTISTWAGDWTIQEFNQRVIVRLGKRRRFLWFFLPWVQMQPRRVIHHMLDDGTGTDEAFWRCDAQ